MAGLYADDSATPLSMTTVTWITDEPNYPHHGRQLNMSTLYCEWAQQDGKLLTDSLGVFCERCLKTVGVILEDVEVIRGNPDSSADSASGYHH